MESIRDKELKKLVDKWGKKTAKRIDNISSIRTNNIFQRYFTNPIESLDSWEDLYLQTAFTLSTAFEKLPELLKKDDIFLIDAMPHQLAPKEWSKQIERDRVKKQIENAQKNKNIKTDVRCPNCKKVGFSYMYDIQQTRSIDEMATQKWKCTACKYHWTIG